MTPATRVIRVPVASQTVRDGCAGMMVVAEAAGRAIVERPVKREPVYSLLVRDRSVEAMAVLANVAPVVVALLARKEAV